MGVFLGTPLPPQRTPCSIYSCLPSPRPCSAFGQRMSAHGARRNSPHNGTNRKADEEVPGVSSTGRKTRRLQPDGLPTLPLQLLLDLHGAGRQGNVSGPLSGMHRFLCPCLCLPSPSLPLIPTFQPTPLITMVIHCSYASPPPLRRCRFTYEIESNQIRSCIPHHSGGMSGVVRTSSCRKTLSGQRAAGNASRRCPFCRSSWWDLSRCC